MAQDSQFNAKEIKRDSYVEKIEYTNWDDIIVIHFNGPVFRPSNLEDYTGDFEITHIDFENKEIEYTKKE